MTVGQLIALLQAFDPMLQVVVSGYEAGLDDPQAPRVMELRVAETTPGILGKYDEVWAGDGPGFSAVAIER